MLFRKGQVFMWEGSQVQAIELLKTVLTTVPALKTLKYNKETDIIIVSINISSTGWEEVLSQVERRGK